MADTSSTAEPLLTPISPSHAARHTRYAGGLLLVFLGLLLIVYLAAPTEIDRRIAAEIQAIHWGQFVFVPHLGSEIGGGVIGFYIAPVVLAGALMALRRWRLLTMLVGVVVLHFVMISPKLFIEAHRPSPLYGVEGGGGLASFPSGHVQWTASFWGFVGLLAWRITPARWRPAIPVLYAALVAAAMLGRIELGKHWPIDTIAGLLAGLIALHLIVAAQLWLHPSHTPVPALARSDERA